MEPQNVLRLLDGHFFTRFRYGWNKSLCENHLVTSITLHKALLLANMASCSSEMILKHLHRLVFVVLKSLNFELDYAKVTFGAPDTKCKITLVSDVLETSGGRLQE